MCACAVCDACFSVCRYIRPDPHMQILEQDFTSSVTLHFHALRQSPSEPEANHFHLGVQLCSVSQGKLYGDMWPGFYRDASDLN